MDPIPLANERIKLFRYSTGVVRDHSTFSQSIAASALGFPSSKDRVDYFQHNSNNQYHSQELTGIPRTVKVDPTDNSDLRIVDLLDSGSTKPFLDSDRAARASSIGCAAHLFHELNTSYPKKNHFGISPPTAQTISFANPTNRKALIAEVLDDCLNYSDRLYVMPQQEFEPLPDPPIQIQPSLPIFIQEPSQRVPRELVGMILPNPRMSS
jgi:hypothetical protein